jgi:DNA-binding NarL/FixJ family response regulator
LLPQKVSSTLSQETAKCRRQHNSWQRFLIGKRPTRTARGAIAIRLMPTRILIADDDAAIRGLLRRILDEHAGWQVCGEAANGRDAILKTEQLSPDIVVIDLAMPQMNGLQAGREIFRSSHLPMLLLTVQEVSPELVQEARRAGFQGAISKSTGVEIVNGIEALLQDQRFFRYSSLNSCS